MRGSLRYAVWWLAAAAVAIAVGVLGVTWTVRSVATRGPIGDHEAIRNAEVTEGTPRPDPGRPLVEDTFTGDFGAVDIGCRGPYAYGVAARPDTAAGWRTVVFERGPDDDVDAVFDSASESIELEVFCNRGRPTLSDLERHRRD